jgi:hypothetical protein
VSTGESVADVDRDVTDLARLLAEREHKLREERDEAQRALAEIDELVGPGGDGTTFGRVESSFLRYQMLQDDLDAARARIAELEVYADTAMVNRDAHKDYAIELEEREAAHLAHIKALRFAAGKVSLRNPADGPCFCVVPIDKGQAHHLCCQLMRRTLSVTAHYDVEGEKPYLVSNSTADSTPVVVLVARDTEGGEG